MAQSEDFVRAAAEEKDPAARRRLLVAVKHDEFFFRMEMRNHDGQVVKSVPLLRLSDGTHAMMLYTSRAHPDLPESCGGDSLKAALTAASKMPELDWVIVSNLASQWFSIPKAQLPAILSALDSGNGEAHHPSDPTGDQLEQLITRASNSSVPAQVWPSISSALSGRELFLEMDSVHSADGRPSMKTFVVQDMPTLRAYLTRKRPDIMYGGMSWEALQQMVRNLPGIQGVQIFNDADDWVLFRDEA